MKPSTQDLTSSPESCHDMYRAQFGEDKILWQVFRQCHSGFFIEVGAYDGVSLSNTFFLEQMGWGGILVEPIFQLCEQAAISRPGSQIMHAACSHPGAERIQKFTITNGVPVLSFLKADADHVERCVREGATLVEVDVPVVTLDEILLHHRDATNSNHDSYVNSQTDNHPHNRVDSHKHDPNNNDPNQYDATPAKCRAWQPNRGWCIDLVSIDVEGGEIDVLNGFNLDRFKPRILVLENDRDSGQDIEPYLTKRGYRKFHTQVINDFYVREDASTADLMVSGFAE